MDKRTFTELDISREVRPARHQANNAARLLDALLSEALAPARDREPEAAE